MHLSAGWWFIQWLALSTLWTAEATWVPSAGKKDICFINKRLWKIEGGCYGFMHYTMLIFYHHNNILITTWIILIVLITTYKAVSIRNHSASYKHDEFGNRCLKCGERELKPSRREVTMTIQWIETSWVTLSS